MQAGECEIDEVGEMIGAGTVRYFPNGVANIIFQFRMAYFSLFILV